MTATITTKQTTTVKLSPALKVTLRNSLSTYARLAEQRRALNAELKHLNATIEQAFVKARETAALDAGVEVEGFKLKMVKGTHSQLSVQLLMDNFGVTPEMIQEATVTKPKRAYLLVTVPGDDDTT